MTTFLVDRNESAQFEGVGPLIGGSVSFGFIQDGDDLLLNLKEELEAFNGHRYSDREFKYKNKRSERQLSPRRRTSATASARSR